MALKQIKGKIRAVHKTHQVTKAMEAVSAVKMRKSQAQAFGSRPYAISALSILKRISRTVDVGKHLFMTERPVSRTLILTITSDKGLAGSLNSGILKKVQIHLASHSLTPENTEFICVGRKGYEYFARRGYAVNWKTDLDRTLSPDSLQTLTFSLLERFRLGEIDQAFVAYPNFVSSFVQEPVIRKILPIEYHGVAEAVDGIIPAKGKYADIGKASEREPLDYLFEPSPAAVLDELIPMLLSIELYHALIEAAASEHSARMVAMKNASDRARDVAAELTLKFNKERQSLITREVSEIIGGIEAMAK